MKRTLLPLFILPQLMFSQVGINTKNPTKTLDVNGDLKISSLSEQTGNPNYRMLVAADGNTDSDKNTHGNIGKITFPALQQNATKNVEIGKSIYIRSTPDSSVTCSCGEITFYVNSSDNKAYFKLNSNNIFSTLGNNVTAFTLGYGVKSWSGTAGTPGDYSYKNITNKEFTTSNYASYQELDDSAFSTNDNANIRIYTMVLPKQNNLYRLTISRLSNTSTTYQYALICEKFYIKPID